MTTPIIKEVNAETGEEIERKATAEEVAQIKADKADSEAEKATAEAKANARAAVLAKLGLTAEEAASLLA